MNPEEFALAVAVAVFAFGLLGLLLQRVLHERHLGVVSRGIFHLRRRIAPRCLWPTNLFSWRSKGRDGRDRFAIGRDGFGRARLRIAEALRLPGGPVFDRSRLPSRTRRLGLALRESSLTRRLQPQSLELLRPVARQVGEAS